MDPKKILMIVALLVLLVIGLFLGNESYSQVAILAPTLTLKNVDGSYIAYQNGMPVPSFEKQNRLMINLAGQWKKQRFPADHNLTLSLRDTANYAALLFEAGDRYKPGFDDNSWEDKDLPAVENIMNAYEVTPEYYEDGIWYRRHFSVPDSLDNYFAKLVFYSVNYVADVWLNGHYLGYHEGGYTPFAFDASPFLRTDTTNILAVRVDNVPWGTREDIIPYIVVDWFNYAGIIHDVYLEFTPEVSFFRSDVIPQDLNGEILVKSLLFNPTVTTKNVDIELAIFEANINGTNIQSELASDLAGSAVAVSGIAQSSLNIPADSIRVWLTTLMVPSPNLWSPKEPNLYILRAQVSESGQLLDEYYTQFGIRTVQPAGDKLLVNGKPVFYTGAARHEDHPTYGRAMPLSQMYTDLTVIKGLNVLFIRTAHYPNHLYTYLLADRLGFAVMEEIPLWWFDEESAWIIHNQRRLHRQMWREMIFRDMNRPSIFLWGTCNECLNVTYRQAFIDSVRMDLLTHFPDGRLVTQSAAADRPGADDSSQAVCDVAGWTMYFGVFHGSTFYQGTHDFLEAAHQAYPEKPILDTEFGLWSSESGANQSAQQACFINTFVAFEEKAAVDGSGTLNPNGFVMAATWWCAFDWYSAGHPYGFQSMGLYHMDRVTTKLVTNIARNKYLPYFYHGGTVTGIENKYNNTLLPTRYSLGQNYPNPFNPSTEIQFALPENAEVELSVFNLQGQNVKTLLKKYLTAGSYAVHFEAQELASGIYFYCLKTNHFTDTRKMILMR
jgi:beta-galactosidase